MEYRPEINSFLLVEHHSKGQVVVQLKWSVNMWRDEWRHTGNDVNKIDSVSFDTDQITRDFKVSNYSDFEKQYPEYCL